MDYCRLASDVLQTLLGLSTLKGRSNVIEFEEPICGLNSGEVVKRRKYINCNVSKANRRVRKALIISI